MCLDLILMNLDYDLLFKTESDFLFARTLIKRRGFNVFLEHINVIISSGLNLKFRDLQWPESVPQSRNHSNKWVDYEILSDLEYKSSPRT